jgi:hypothetical protein
MAVDALLSHISLKSSSRGADSPRAAEPTSASTDDTEGNSNVSRKRTSNRSDSVHLRWPVDSLEAFIRFAGDSNGAP